MQKFLKVVSMLTLLIFLRTGFALAAEQVYFYYNDPAGTPLAMSDATGTVVWRADYLPFGEETIDLSTVQNNKMFVGKEQDSESGLYYFGARYMYPTAGRFISPDIAEPVNVTTGKVNDKFLINPQRLNKYAYAGNNPYAYFDPLGLDWYYAQRTGHLIYANLSGQLYQYIDFGNIGISGNGPDRNNPASQGKINKGPIVTGTYEIEFMQGNYTTNEGKVLKNVMELTPDAKTAQAIKSNNRTGGYLIHEPSVGKDGVSRTAGCIGLPEDIRMIMNDILYQNYGDPGDTTLHVEATDANFPSNKANSGSSGASSQAVSNQ